eukprot:GSChrysophyteH1.ASY1.ANO1.3303.1 assembled CDS
MDPPPSIFISSCVSEDGSDAYQIPVDTCQVRFSINGNQKLFSQYTLLAVNADCWKCAPQPVFTSVSQPGECANLWTPFDWTFTLHDNVLDQTVLGASLDVKLGEQGLYEISATFDSPAGALQPSFQSLDYSTVVAPIDSLEPLWIWLFALVNPLEPESSIWTEKPSIDESSIESRALQDPLLKASAPSSPGVRFRGASDPSTPENSANASAQEMQNSTPSTPSPKPASSRIDCLDTFRGMCLLFMIFVNYGGGGYWFFDHASWNGLTFADLLFPWFMFVMGCSIALSYRRLHTSEYRGEKPWVLWKRVFRRASILFGLGLFLNNGFTVTGPSGHWRIPGVLQYFGIATLIVAGTVLISKWAPIEKPPSVLYCYYYEYIVMLTIFFTYLTVCLAANAPGCPTGYAGPGGIGNEGDDTECTGGIHRYIDLQFFGSQHIYMEPTCVQLYQCQSYDPEGLLGSLTACIVAYLGLFTGRILLHFPGHSDRLYRWLGAGAVLCFLAGCLCGFSQNEGLVPVNKNLWSASFGLVTSGFGMIGLSIVYVLVDVHKFWTGAPFTYLGLNSILLFMAHEIFQEYFPFSWQLQYPSHASLLFMNIVGASLWALIARYLYSVKFFLKI